MTEQQLLIHKLENYSQSEALPMHMPGHKRNPLPFPNPYSIDITEIHGFDNLHHPEECLKQSMEWAASVYGSQHSYYLVNGSSCGILSAVFAATSPGGHILMARNCHKSAFHAALLRQLAITDLYPQILPHFHIQGDISPQDVQTILDMDPSIEAVLVVSPTYEGIVSDISSLSQICHRHNVPLIVDEAHGAHLAFSDGNYFPKSALSCGADLVIQSLHKTLPSFTQTAILHLQGNLISAETLQQYLQIFQSSSPSYLFLAAIERCIYEMNQHGQEDMKALENRIRHLRTALSQLSVLSLLPEKLPVYAQDPSRLPVFTPGSGETLSTLLRNSYNIEMEMAGANFSTAILTTSDNDNAFKRLESALLTIDQTCVASLTAQGQAPVPDTQNFLPPQKFCRLHEALHSTKETLRFPQTAGRVSGEFVYVYPPGIPLLLPGEVISPAILSQIQFYREQGYALQGFTDSTGQTIQVLK